MSTVSGEKPLSVLNEENQAEATKSSQKRWSSFKKLRIGAPLVVLMVGGLWLWRSSDSPVYHEPSFSSTGAGTTAVPAPAAPPIPVHPLCAEYPDGPKLPGCEVLALSATRQQMYAGPGYCLKDIPGGSAKFAVSGRGHGWYDITSLDGQPHEVAVFVLQAGRTVAGRTCPLVVATP